MKPASQLLMIVSGFVMFTGTALATGIYGSGGVASQYNPWRPQVQQWGYSNQNNGRSHVSPHAEGTMPYPLYAVPMSRIPARQFEYRRYIQQVNPYYSHQVPWWSDPVAVPYGPWAFGNNGVNGFW